MTAENFITFLYQDPIKEAERRLKLVDLIMEELGAVPDGKNDFGIIWHYRQKHFCSSIITNNKTKIVIYTVNEDNTYKITAETDYDSLVCDFYYIVQCALGILPNNNSSVSLNHYERLLAESEHFAITSEFEYAFFYDKHRNHYSEVGFFYGEPDAALIDRYERFFIILGEMVDDHDNIASNIIIYDMNGRIIKELSSTWEYVYYIIQTKDKIMIRKENTGLIEIEIDAIINNQKNKEKE